MLRKDANINLSPQQLDNGSPLPLLPSCHRSPKHSNRKLKTANRNQKSEIRKRKTENSKQKPEIRKRKTEKSPPPLSQLLLLLPKAFHFNPPKMSHPILDKIYLKQSKPHCHRCIISMFFLRKRLNLYILYVLEMRKHI